MIRLIIFLITVDLLYMVKIGSIILKEKHLIVEDGESELVLLAVKSLAFSLISLSLLFN